MGCRKQKEPLNTNLNIMNQNQEEGQSNCRTSNPEQMGPKKIDKIFIKKTKFYLLKQSYYSMPYYFSSPFEQKSSKRRRRRRRKR